MPLSNEQIKALLKKQEEKKRAGRKPKGPDTSVRDYQTWFKLQHRMFDMELNRDVKCENPNCIDPRPHKITAMGQSVRVQACALVNGQHMCRYCFMEGWLLEDPNQLKIAEG